MKKIAILSITFMLFANSCALTSFYKTKSSAPSFYVTFFVANGINQYFIKPIEFKSSKDILKIDFTFRDTCKYETFIIVNYSIFSKDLIKNVDSAYFLINGKKIYFKESEKLFIESKKQYQIRQSNKITYKELLDVFSNRSEIYIFTSGKVLKFVPSNKTEKIRAKAQKIIFENIELNRKN